MASFETVKQRRDRLATELEKLNKIDNKTPEQKKRATKLFNEVRLLDSRIIQAKELKDKRAGTLEKAKTAKDEKKRIRKTKKAEVLTPTKQTVLPERRPTVEPPVKTKPTGEAEVKRATVAEDFPKRKKETWKERQARLSEEFKASPRKESSAATRADPDAASVRGAIRKKDTAAIAKDVKLAKEKRDKRATERRSQLRSKEGLAQYDDAKNYQIAYNSPNRPGKDRIGVSSKDPWLTEAKVKAGTTEAIKDAEKGTSGRFGTKAGARAIKKFFKDAFDADITVDYKFPGDKGYGSPQGGKKKGGKVTSKRSSTKKYAMNRGGKVASVRKPTRA